ncbi:MULTISPECIES: hypothetical protein [Bacillaceae]|nr:MULTISPECIES: hypothetical protein [Bacillaceae]
MQSDKYEKLELLLKEAAHQCKMKDIVFQVNDSLPGLNVNRQTSLINEGE